MIAAIRNVSRAKLAWFGFALIFTPFYFVTAAVLKYGFGVGLFFDPVILRISPGAERDWGRALSDYS